MNKEELLKPRYKVIADYPMMTLFDGLIINKTFFPKEKHGTYFYNGHDVTKYPHLFKPLQWWEDRKPEDMPEYVKWTHPGVKTLSDYFKVFQWQKNSVGAWLCDVKEAHLYISDVVPADEQEYLDYLTQQNKP